MLNVGLITDYATYNLMKLNLDLIISNQAHENGT